MLNGARGGKETASLGGENRDEPSGVGQVKDAVAKKVVGFNKKAEQLLRDMLSQLLNK